MEPLTVEYVHWRRPAVVRTPITALRWCTVGYLPTAVGFTGRFLGRPPKPHPQFHPLRLAATGDSATVASMGGPA
ncbi:hypothetical protein [Micromonospora aurantiaca (nom. illeg.)]|uniref:hypothetical protein n=1 Tax=Micromonospora aurantiaca (nom. illeg.) TaxID=47850 RepID=UPI0033FE12FA